MDVICPQCGTTYELDESQIQGKSVRVKCSACEYMFRVYRPTPSQIIPALQTWIVRSSDGVVSHVPDQSTLQRMIVERKVGRGDELSRDGRAWQLLGDVPDFRPFFAIVEEATTSSTMLQAVTGSGVAFNAVQTTTPDIAGVPASMGVQPVGVQPVTVQPSPAAAAAGIQGAVLLAGEMDPSSTLEFGLPGAKTDIGVVAAPAVQPTPVSYGQPTAAPAVVATPAPVVQTTNEATEVALEGVALSEAERVQSSAVPVALAPVSSPPASDAPLPVEAPPTDPPPSSQLVGGSGSQEMSVRVSPPTSTSFEGDALVSREPDESFDLAPENDADWFEGSRVELDAPLDTEISTPANGASSSLSFDDEPPNSSSPMNLDTGMRDFSSYSDEFFTSDSSDDFDMPQASNKGLWIFLSVLGLVLVIGGFYVLLPDTAARINVALGLAEATPAAMKKVGAAQDAIGEFTLEGFTKAQNLLKEAETLHGKPFPTSLATRIEVELGRTEYRLYQMELARKNRAFWEQKQKEVDAAIAKIPADDAEKAKKVAAFTLKKKAYQAQIDTQGKKRADALEHYKKHWQAASKYRNEALQLDGKHPAVELAELHLYSLSADADKKFRPLYTKLLKKEYPNLANVQTRLFLLAAWVSLHQKQQNQSLNRIRKVLLDKPKWAYPRLLQARAWAESERRDDAINSIQSLFKSQAKHPLGVAMMAYLKQLAMATKPAPAAPAVAAGNAPDGRKPAPAVAGKAPAPRTAKAPAGRRPVARRRSGGGGSYRSLMRAADRQRRRERYSSARRYYLRALKIKKSSRAYSGLGWCMLESSGPGAAIGHFKTAMRISSRNPDAYFGLGMAYRRQRKTAQARSVLKQFLSRFSRHRDAGEVRMILKSLR